MVRSLITNNTNNNGIYKKIVKLFPQPKKKLTYLIIDKNGVLGYIDRFCVLTFFFSHTNRHSTTTTTSEDNFQLKQKFHFFGRNLKF